MLKYVGNLVEFFSWYPADDDVFSWQNVLLGGLGNGKQIVS